MWSVSVVRAGRGLRELTFLNYLKLLEGPGADPDGSLSLSLPRSYHGPSGPQGTHTHTASYKQPSTEPAEAGDPDAVSLGERPDVGLKAQTGLVDVGLGHDA